MPLSLSVSKPDPTAYTFVSAGRMTGSSREAVDEETKYSRVPSCPAGATSTVSRLSGLDDIGRADAAPGGQQQHGQQRVPAPHRSPVGSSTVNTAPPTGRFAARTVPPCSRTFSWAMARPRPLPADRVRAASAL